MDGERYRRRQRRRALIGWGALVAVIALVLVGIALGSDEGHSGDRTAGIGIFTASMTSGEYESLRDGEEKAIIIGRLGNVGMEEGEIQEELLVLFPSQPGNSNCAFWFLSDAPEHLVRLCFDDRRDVLVQKSVAAQGEDAAPKTLV